MGPRRILIPTPAAVHDPASPASDAPDDAAEFQALLSPVLDGAYGTALRLAGSRADAEDLVQEAALNAFRGFRTFQRGTNFRAWFYRVMMNAFYAGKRRRRPETSLDALEEAPPAFLFQQARRHGLLAEDGDPARAVLDRIGVEAAERALAALPEDFRIVATLYFMDDLPYQEIADVIGVPVGTVRSRLHRGRKLLQQALWTEAVDAGVVPAAAGEGA